MLFNSFAFLLGFMPIAAAGYWLLVNYATVAFSMLWLGALSYYFYVSGETIYPWLIVLSILVNFAVARTMQQKDGDAGGRLRKQILISGIVFDLAVLGYFKYSNFGVDQLRALHLIGALHWDVALPIGVSFYTFTQIAFLVDVYKRRAAERNFIPYFLFVSYFPHLIAGPILHHAEMLPQFRNPDRRGIGANLFPGLSMITIGLAKKVLIADACGAVATSIFDGAADTHHGFFVAWTGALAYTLQIYFDFSGYSDMAIGASKLLGIDLPVNFNSPYKSRSIIDFWRRWHITLSRFLRDYLYFPLGGNRRGRSRRYVNLFVTMLLGGAWHGAGWNFVLWGAMHGAAQSVAHGWNDVGRRVRVPNIPWAVGWAATMLFVVVAWVPFRAHSLADAASLWGGMLGLYGFAPPALGAVLRVAHYHGPVEDVTFGGFGMSVIAMAALLATCAPNSQQLLRRYGIGLDSPGYHAHGKPMAVALAANWRWALTVGLLLGLAMRAIGGYSEFIYFHF